MKIAVTAKEDSLESSFEPRFGRSAGFMLFDTDSQETSFIDNTSNQNLSQGAGIQTAKMIADQGVEVLITGNIGPKASQALSNTNIQIHQFSGTTVRQAIQAHQNGQLESFSTQNTQSSSPGGTGRGMGGGRGKGSGRGMGGGGGMGMGGGGRGRKR